MDAIYKLALKHHEPLPEIFHTRKGEPVQSPFLVTFFFVILALLVPLASIYKIKEFKVFRMSSTEPFNITLALLAIVNTAFFLYLNMFQAVALLVPVSLGIWYFV
jgi:hypothetical protein